ncbi:EF hand family protein [Toxoplasma gondii MAS]|uniref:EF hand family protein n=2 Tax=Toxoplasma gondii TaxID=5811 RepID=A0A086Q847_TOXGO|nr:EF hand family protein [Toxoplasma gondii MAS]PUA85245.1 EF hand family protein [Toxoplasma gondii TgCATBr9]
MLTEGRSEPVPEPDLSCRIHSVCFTPSNAENPGELSVLKKIKRLSASLQPATLSKSEDGYLHFGQRVMIVNERTGGFLCADVGDKTEKTTGVSFACATGPSYDSCVRNVFHLCRPINDDSFGSDTVIHFGQPVTVKVDASLSQLCPVKHGNQDRYLHSEIRSPISLAKFSNYQQVLFCPTTSANTVWKIFHVDPRVRFETEGCPVPANTPIVIKHAQTDQMLASSPKVNYRNDYGVEYEVHCKSYLATNKTQNLIAEACGRTTSDIDLRQQETENNWMIITADTHSESQASSTTES